MVAALLWLVRNCQHDWFLHVDRTTRLGAWAEIYDGNNASRKMLLENKPMNPASPIETPAIDWCVQVCETFDDPHNAKEAEEELDGLKRRVASLEQELEDTLRDYGQDKNTMAELRKRVEAFETVIEELRRELNIASKEAYGMRSWPPPKTS